MKPKVTNSDEQYVTLSLELRISSLMELRFFIPLSQCFNKVGVLFVAHVRPPPHANIPLSHKDINSWSLGKLTAPSYILLSFQHFLKITQVNFLFKHFLYCYISKTDLVTKPSMDNWRTDITFETFPISNPPPPPPQPKP